MGRLQDRVAIVTGAGRGIGAAIATLLAAHGAAVVVNDLGVALDGSKGEDVSGSRVVRDIVAAGGTAVADATDIVDHTAAAALVESTIARFGRLDILANVAGILRDRMIFNMTELEWDAVINVHLKGHFNMIRPAAAYWRDLAQPDAHHRIINFTSGSGLRGAAGQPNYAAAKMGIVGLTWSCANALRRYGVTCNAVAPAAHTRMTASSPAWPAERSEDEEWSPTNVAPLVAYLATEASDWCNGRVLWAGGYEVALYSNPEILRAVRSSGPWDLDELGGAVEAAFRPMVEGAPGEHVVSVRSPVGGAG